MTASIPLTSDGRIAGVKELGIFAAAVTIDCFPRATNLKGRVGMSSGMVSAGYMVKAIATKPDWLSGAEHVQDIYSLCDCISRNFCELSDHWRHNGHWLFDDLQTIRQIASQNVIDLSAMSWFYYEVYDQDYDEEEKSWTAYEIDDFPTNVVAASEKKLCGFDLVSFSTGNRPECSPLSCNHLCEIVETNEHCLLPTFERAVELVQSAAFDRVEPGPYRIFAVYEIDAAAVGESHKDTLPR